MGFARTIVPASVVSGVGCRQGLAPSLETRTTMRELDQVAPGRITLKSQTSPSGACQTTALPSGESGLGVMRSGLDHLDCPFGKRAPKTPESALYSPEPP